jgi:hypothetical protein
MDLDVTFKFFGGGSCDSPFVFELLLSIAVLLGKVHRVALRIGELASFSLGQSGFSRSFCLEILR